MPSKKYVAFGSTTITVPPKMVGKDSKNKLHIWDTITPVRHQLSYHNKKTAINLTTNSKSNTKIQKVPRTTSYMSYETNEPRLPRQPRQPRVIQQQILPVALAPTPALAPIPAPTPAPTPAPIARISPIVNPIENNAARLIQSNFKMKMARKQLANLERKKKVEETMKKYNVNIGLRVDTAPIARISPMVDSYEKERLKQIEEIEKKQKSREKELNRNEIRKEQKRQEIKDKTEKQVREAAAKTIQKLIRKVKNKDITDNTTKEAAQLIQQNFKARIARVKLQKLRNKKLQQKLLESNIESTNMIQQLKEKKALEKNHETQMKKIEKIDKQTDKEDRLKEPISFPDETSKKWYIDNWRDEAEINRQEGLKIANKVKELQLKPYSYRNQEKIYEMTQDAYVYALAYARIIKKAIRGEKIRVEQQLIRPYTKEEINAMTEAEVIKFLKDRASLFDGVLRAPKKGKDPDDVRYAYNYYQRIQYKKLRNSS